MNRCFAVRFVVVVVLTSLHTAEGAWKVWTITSTRRVLRSERAGDTLRVSLEAARNEKESFQILMRSDDAVKGITLRAGDLKGPGGAVLRARDARLYRQQQIEIRKGTVRNDSFTPGWYPDPLIPFRHPGTRKPLRNARFTAIPFDLPPDQTHGFWIDIHVPATAKPGEYKGTYRVEADGGRTIDVPVTLTVWNFTLPRVSTLVTAFGSPAQRMRSYYRSRAKEGKEKEPADWAQVEKQCSEMLTRHRINCEPPPGSLTPKVQADGSYRIPAAQVDALRTFVDHCHVNAIRVPSPARIVDDPEKEQGKLRAWLAAWDRAAEDLKRPFVTFYIYLKDEPNDGDAYRFVQKWGRAVCAMTSQVKVMVVEQTWTQNEKWGDLYGAVDVWCPLFSLFKPEHAAKRQALGETIWTYTALCQRDPTPWWHIDHPLLNYRVPAWIAWRYRMRGLLYWGGMSYWRQVEDPWICAWTYGRPSRVYNGEGTIVYPARAAGYEGIAPSLRLKALRDSIEDYEYLAILERNGRASDAQKVVLPLAASWFDWGKDPAAYRRARRTLAGMITEGAE